MLNDATLGEIQQANFTNLVSTEAHTKSEIQAVSSMVETITNWPLNNRNGLHSRLLIDAKAIRPLRKREDFVIRVIDELNHQFDTRFIAPKRTFPKDVYALASADNFTSYLASLATVLLHRAPPGPLKFALLMTSNIGVNKRVVFNYLVAGSKCLSRDKAFNLPISNKDNKHHHSFWLPPELRTQITDCLKTLESSYTKQSAKLILKKELKSLINQILEEGIHPKDRRPGVTHLKRIMELNDFDFRDVTVSKLLESAYMYGVAAHMPGELRDMLAQPNLPASAIRLRLYSQAPRAKPHSPNIGIKNPTPADVFLTKDTEWQNLRVKYLRDTDSVSEDFWLDNMETAMNCLAFMTQSDLSEDQKTKKIGETLYGKSGIYQNSWCVIPPENNSV